MAELVTAMLVPMILCAVALYACWKGIDVYAALIRGAGGGLDILAHIAPSLVALLTAVYMLRASGAVELLAGLLGPLLERVGLSPELLPPDANGKIAQKTEEKIGPYELHDFFLYHFVRFGFDREKLALLAEKAFDGRYDRPTIDRWLTEFLRRFFISQFKRSCIPDSPKVGSVSLSPRGDWRMPSDAAMQAFLQPDERI